MLQEMFPNSRQFEMTGLYCLYLTTFHLTHENLYGR